jgi:diguanylate cyclase (GGDEF)-like protein
MELLLYRWSTGAQIVSALMIAAFFLTLTRSVRRVELRPWTQAWLANLVALLATVAFWFLQPNSPIAFMLLRFGYFFGKTLFAILLAVGAWAFVRARVGKRTRKRLVAAALIFAAVAAYFVDSINKIGVIQSALTAGLLLAGAGILVAKRPYGTGGLTAGLIVRAILGVIESIAYGSQLFPNTWSSSRGIAFFLAAHSSLDTGAEWIIALGCVLTLHRTIQLELTKANDDLRSAQKVLQDLVDHDVLTTLPNRRVLPAALRAAFSTGATLLFFDLNDFKSINDAYGHQAGDDCLKRFAHTLQSSFRPDDQVIRYAGDEFVVVANGALPEQVLPHLDRLRDRLRFERRSGPDIEFSVGYSYLAAGGDPEAALREADAAMYDVKAGRRGGAGRAAAVSPSSSR